jgi:hypothetical protein
MRIYDFLFSIAGALGDARQNTPFRRHTLKDLAMFYSEALCYVKTHRPDLFTDYVVMRLQTGRDQDARCCGCDNVMGVHAQVDKDGNTVKHMDATGTPTSNTSRWYRTPCRESQANVSGTILTNYTIDPGMNGNFTVTPPVPPGEDVWVKLKCVKSPESISEADVLMGKTTGDCKFLPAIRSYIMYRALQGNRHAVGATQESQNEINNVKAYLGIQYKMEIEQEKANGLQ